MEMNNNSNDIIDSNDKTMILAAIQQQRQQWQ